jgi:hypothetical protein
MRCHKINDFSTNVPLQKVSEIVKSQKARYPVIQLILRLYLTCGVVEVICKVINDKMIGE